MAAETNGYDDKLVTPRDLELMRQLVIGIAPAATNAVHVAVGQPAPTGSKAEQYLLDPLNLPTATAGGTHVQSAYFAIAFYALAAVDHMRAFVTVLKNSQHAMALATVTRGAVEPFGKAHYLVSADSGRELLRRYLSLGVEELEMSSRHNEFYTLAGQPIDGVAYVRALKTAFDEHGIGRPEKVRVTTLASDVLSASSPGAPARSVYSQLSGVAHGEPAGVAMFLAPDWEAGVRFVRRRELVIPYAAILFTTCRLVVGEVIEHFGVVGKYRDQWLGALERAQAWVDELRAVAPGLV